MEALVINANNGPEYLPDTSMDEICSRLGTDNPKFYEAGLDLVILSSDYPHLHINCVASSLANDQVYGTAIAVKPEDLD